MKPFTFFNYSFLSLFIVIVSCAPAATVDNSPTKTEPIDDMIEELKIDNLLRESLGLAENVEVIVSYLEVPPNSTLPTHYHPGEEFVYIMQGSGELSLDGDSTLTLDQGEVFKVPLKKVHSFSTREESVRGIVFRVHEKGQPDRILVE